MKKISFEPKSIPDGKIRKSKTRPGIQTPSMGSGVVERASGVGKKIYEDVGGDN